MLKSSGLQRTWVAPHPPTLLLAEPIHGLYLGPASLGVCRFIWQMSYGPGVSSILGFPLQPSHHFHSFMLWPWRTTFWGLWPCHTFPGLSNSLGLLCKTQWLPQFCIFMPADGMWMMLPSSAASFGWSLLHIGPWLHWPMGKHAPRLLFLCSKSSLVSFHVAVIKYKSGLREKVYLAYNSSMPVLGSFSPF